MSPFRIGTKSGKKRMKIRSFSAWFSVAACRRFLSLKSCRFPRHCWKVGHKQDVWDISQKAHFCPYPEYQKVARTESARTLAGFSDFRGGRGVIVA
jgi:hypothetical protein